MNTPNPIIELTPKREGYYFAIINGVETDIKSPYRNVVRRKATQYLNEQAEQAQKALFLKEIGL